MNVMVDIETLGKRPGAAILSIGACEFNDGGVVPHTRFYRAVDLFSSLMAGLVTDESTIEWWRQQTQAAKDAAQPAKGRVTLHEALLDFAAYVTKDTLVWAKGPDFDLVLLDEAYQRTKLTKPWSYRNTRDVRTICGLVPKLALAANNFKHYALADAEAQAETVIAAAKLLGVSLG